ncbi:hypothetical protein EJ08DRAFT_692963 [Tothia fuscella]|uniref:Uncharacterized protein n=1 Tax=Tothia fuscella TaxID=1048955 RepID=A0A9P4U2Z6_9PEZI|nr:hypothetical protein EJ08DRAFT_692963 [Tothia fuscella]
MCLIKVRKDEEEEAVAYRRVTREERYRTHSPRRSSRIVVAPRPPSVVVVPTPQPLPIPTPVPKALPPPQPFPTFVAPPPAPAPAPHTHNPEVHYVHVSPRSSISDHGHDDYRYERREVRYERDYSPVRGGDNYEYRYVGAPQPPRGRDRSRSRSRGRDYYDDDDDRRGSTNVRVSRRTHDARY